MDQVISKGKTILVYIRLLKPLIRKGRFSSPEKNNLLIWDALGSQFISDHVLEGIDHTILHTREEFYYGILYIRSVLKYFSQGLSRRKEGDNTPDLLLLYYLECIRYINPRVVITFTDNDVRFHQISSRYQEARFYAIQNGVRIVNDRIEYSRAALEKINFKEVSQYSSPNFLCFGNCEVNFYKKYGALIKDYHPVGSLKGSWYYYSKPREETIPVYAICLVSQYRSVFFSGAYPEVLSSLQIMEGFLRQFIDETSLSLCVATAGRTSEELDYFSEKFGPLTSIIVNNQDEFTTYQAMDKSSVIISFYSTAALEAFGWGKKVLFCNYSENPQRGFGFSDTCYTDIPEYQCFKAKLTTLLEMKEDEYREKNLVHQKYYMNYDKNIPATIYLRSLIKNDLGI